jgi:release factor glutamine methyltransferase
VTIGEAQKQGEDVLRSGGIESARLDASLLLEKVTGRSRSWLLAHDEKKLSDEQEHTFMELVDRRRSRIPLVHLTNQREFYGLDLYIDDRVLTPRVETEKMVDYAIKYAPRDSRLIDIGTGSGALAIVIKHHRPDLDVWATDVSSEALEVAKRNASRLNMLLNMFNANLLDKVEGQFATVVTNLPYLRDDADLMPEVQKEPQVALLGGSDGLELYRKFLEQLPDHLEPNGYLFTECDPWQHEALIAEAAKAGLTPIEQSDYFILGFQRS